MMRTLPSSILFLAILLLSSLTTRADPESNDLVIQGDETWRQREVIIDGDLLVESGATLRLEGTSLRLGGVLRVEPGAWLQTAASGSHRTVLGPAEGGQDFWVDIQGSLASVETDVIALAGEGLLSVISGEGGLQVSGVATFERSAVEGGSAGIIVRPGGEVVLEESTVRRMGEVGILTLGQLDIRGSTIAENDVGVLGKDGCVISIEGSTLADAGSEHLIVNGCSATVQDSVLTGGGVSLAANNGADLRVERTVLAHYSVDALNAFVVSPSAGRPTVHLRDVVAVPGPGAQRGADLSGVEYAEFVNVTIGGHASHGIRARESALLVTDSTIHGNGGFGIRLEGGNLVSDALADPSNDFGLAIDASSNSLGAVSHIAVVRFYPVDDRARLVHTHGSLEVTVFGSDGDPLAGVVQRAIGADILELQFPTYGESADGDLTSLGPFRFLARHSGFDMRWDGALDLTTNVVELPAGDVASSGGSLGVGYLVMGGLAFLAGAVWFFFGIAKSRPAAWFRRRSTAEEEPK